MSKQVLVTGSGFGRAASLALAERGHRVIAATETDEQAEDLRSEAPGLTVERLDITTGDIDKAGGWELDVLVNNAAVVQTGPLADIPLPRVRRTFEVNVFGTLSLTQAVLTGQAEVILLHGGSPPQHTRGAWPDGPEDVATAIQEYVDSVSQLLAP